MGRILAIDYGTKRTGIAVTDPLQMIATGLTTVRTMDLLQFIGDYMLKEPVDAIVIGEPKQMDSTASVTERFILPFINQLKKKFPELPVERFDERFTSMMAQQSMIDMGMKKKDRQNKFTIDQISATIILQSYLERKK
jgi:putative holliday junction resolvase